MIWLAVQIIFELLLAAAIGGAIGWALHIRFGKAAAPREAKPVTAAASITDPNGRVKIVELEAKLRQERDEAAELRRKLSAAERQSAQAEGGDENAVAWRNRYLDSKVRFLEGKLADIEASAAPDAPQEDHNDEPTRLRWRNRYLDGRVKYLEEELKRGGVLRVAEIAPAEPAPVVEAPPVVAAVKTPPAPKGPPPGAEKPLTLEGPRNGVADDLRKISGVGPKIEKTLHGLGVFHYDQIAAWTQKEIDWVNASLSFSGRVERDKWVAQARELAGQGTLPA